jgi:ABC-2 type transport system ATP-binding protein
MQEVCDRVGIMAHGVMVKEGRLEDLIAVENQTELVLENVDEALLGRIREMVAASGDGARVVRTGSPRTTLERLFLESTDEGGKGGN